MVRFPCCTEEGLNRGAWSAVEDMILFEYIRIHGDGRWRKLPQKAGLKRCGKSCRLRWVNYLRPDIKRGNISPDEEELIFRLHRLLGNRWSLIAGRLPRRTGNEIKNYWNSHLKKKLLTVGSQPKTMSKSPFIQNHVFKTSPVRVTGAVKHTEMVAANGCSNRISSDHAFKLSTIEQNTNSSMSSSILLVNDSITAEDSQCIAFEMEDIAYQGRKSTCSMSSLDGHQSPHSDNFEAHGATPADNLLDENEPSSPKFNLLSSPSFWTDFGLEEFQMELATSLDVETNEFEDMCYDQSNTKSVNSFIFVDDGGMEEFCNTKNVNSFIFVDDGGLEEFYNNSQHLD